LRALKALSIVLKALYIYEGDRKEGQGGDIWIFEIMYMAEEHHRILRILNLNSTPSPPTFTWI
jgi:hypothetical protein